MSNDPSRPRVLIVDEAFATALDSGKRMRTAHLLRRCAARFELTYLAYAEEDEAEAAAEAWNPHGVETIAVKPPKVPKSGLGLMWTMGRTLLRRDPASVAAWETDLMKDAVARLLDERSYDLVHCEITQMAWVTPFGRPEPTVLDAHNVESVIWERLAQVSSPPRSWVFRDQARKFAGFEERILPAFDRVVAVSELDRERMIERFGLDRVTVVPNGVDLDVDPAPRDGDGPGTILYPGSLDWRPAQQGAVWLLQKVLPYVREELPDVRVEIVGKGPPAWLRTMCEETPGAECHGSVPSMTPHFRRAGVVAVPLLVGSGSRLKILEAFAHGRPVVSTRVGAEGLEVESGRHLDIADDPEVFARAVAALLGDRERGAAYAAEGRALVERSYGWSAIADQLMDVWHRVLNER